MLTDKFSQSKSFVGDAYPEMVIAFVPLDQVHGSTDIARLQVTHSLGGDTWALKTDLRLPENASSVVDVCAGTLAVGRGYFAIYIIQGLFRRLQIRVAVYWSQGSCNLSSPTLIPNTPFK